MAPGHRGGRPQHGEPDPHRVRRQHQPPGARPGAGEEPDQRLAEVDLGEDRHQHHQRDQGVAPADVLGCRRAGRDDPVEQPERGVHDRVEHQRVGVAVHRHRDLATQAREVARGAGAVAREHLGLPVPVVQDLDRRSSAPDGSRGAYRSNAAYPAPVTAVGSIVARYDPEQGRRGAGGARAGALPPDREPGRRPGERRHRRRVPHHAADRRPRAAGVERVRRVRGPGQPGRRRPRLPAHRVPRRRVRRPADDPHRAPAVGPRQAPVQHRGPVGAGEGQFLVRRERLAVRPAHGQPRRHGTHPRQRRRPGAVGARAARTPSTSTSSPTAGTTAPRCVPSIS